MNDSESKAVISKCNRCEKPMSTPIVCDYCHSLSSPGVADYFTMFGLPRRFDLDLEVLRGKFLSVSRNVHPDYHVADSQESQSLSLQISAAVNDAYRTLSDPPSRAAYLLELLGGKSSADDKSVPDGFLETMMMMQEELADAKTAGVQPELDRLREVLTTQHEGLMRRISGLFEDYQQAVSCEAVRNDLLREIRQQLNAVSYVKKLLSQL